LCVESDRKNFDETYWHRLHQVPGVEICPIHKVCIEDSKIHVRHRASREAFVPAEQAVHADSVRYFYERDKNYHVYLSIARDAAWLLEHSEVVTDSSIHRNRYIELLFERDFSTYNGSVNTRKLIDDVEKHYTRKFLETLGCPLDGQVTWLHRLVRNTGNAHHPLQHLLLIQFLGHTIESFLQLSGHRLPFGEGPWPCLNRASDHYGQFLIKKHSLKTTQLHRRPRGTFSCECGFSYFRIGPDQSSDASFKKNGYVALGKVWTNALKTLHAKGLHSQKEIAALLDVSPGTIAKQLMQLDLAPPPGIDAHAEDIIPVIGDRAKKPIDSSLRKTNRKVCLNAVRTNPKAGRYQLRVKHQAIYLWLYKNDKAWLVDHQPPLQKRKGPPKRFNWSLRDLEIAALVKAEAELMMKIPGRPIRVSATAIIKRIDKWAVRNIDNRYKFPLTFDALNKVTESAEEYAVRRVLWAAEYYSEKEICPGVWQLQLKACLSNKMAKHRKVKSAVESSILILKSTVPCQKGFRSNVRSESIKQ
jgi:DNA-binding Lrp family transcriptional regulator